ncbi:Gonadotropin-releasing hormone receptor, partial [Frankliniella fusca]
SPAPVYKLILHLSVADVVVSLVCIAGEAIWMFMVQWTFGNVACKVWKFLEMTALHGSSYVVVLIAQNRWVAVSHPLASRRPKSAVCGCGLVRDVLRCASPRSVLLVWVLGACLSIPQLMMFSVQVGPFYEEYYQCVTYDVGATLERVYNIINFIALFVIPLLGLIVSYLSIYCTLSKGQREIRSVDKVSIATHDQNRQRSMKRAMVKSRWIAVVIVCAYLVSWLPYYITMLVYYLSPGRDTTEDDPHWMGWIFFCGMANSVINPAIYGMFQLWKPKRRKQWSCFRHRDGSTQLTQFTDSFRRHGTIGMASLETAIPVAESNGGAPASPQPQPPPATTTTTDSTPPKPPCPPPTPPCAPPAPPPPPPPAPAAEAEAEDEAAAETTLTLIGNSVKTSERVLGAERGGGGGAPVISAVLRKATPFSWRNKFLRKYRALRAHTAQHAHI